MLAKRCRLEGLGASNSHDGTLHAAVSSERRWNGTHVGLPRRCSKPSEIQRLPFFRPCRWRPNLTFHAHLMARWTTIKATARICWSGKKSSCHAPQESRSAQRRRCSTCLDRHPVVLLALPRSLGPIKPAIGPTWLPSLSCERRALRHAHLHLSGVVLEGKLPTTLALVSPECWCCGQLTLGDSGIGTVVLLHVVVLADLLYLTACCRPEM